MIIKPKVLEAISLNLTQQSYRGKVKVKREKGSPEIGEESNRKSI